MFFITKFAFFLLCAKFACMFFKVNLITVLMLGEFGCHIK